MYSVEYYGLAVIIRISRKSANVSIRGKVQKIKDQKIDFVPGNNSSLRQ